MIIDCSKIKESFKIKKITISWAKNTALPLLFLAAGLCCKHKKNIKLINAPGSIDVSICMSILWDVWIIYTYNKISHVIDFYGEKSQIRNNINSALYGKVRYSILLLWLLLSFFNEIKIPDSTWWCNIQWIRKNDIHYDFFEKIGYKIIFLEDSIIIRKGDDHIDCIEYTLRIASTSVSENILIYLLLNANKFPKITITNFYYRPDIKELFLFCKKFGYNILVNNNILSWIFYSKPKKNKNIKFLIISDFDQLLFYIFLWLISQNIIEIKNYNNAYVYKEMKVINHLFKWLVECNKKSKYVKINYKKCVFNKRIPIEIIADTYPNIMSDSQPILSLISLYYPSIKIYDTRFPNRYDYAEYYRLMWFTNTFKANMLQIERLEQTKTEWTLNNHSFNLFSIRESWLLLLLGIYTKSKFSIDNHQILHRWYDNIASNLYVMWIKIW